MVDYSLLLYKPARVTGRISPGSIGEVMASVNGGSEAFLAYSFDGTEVIQAGEVVLIVEYHPPRTVVVARPSVKEENA